MEKNVSKFDKDFIKSYDEDSDEGYILEAKIEYPKDLQDLDSDYHSSMKQRKLINVISLYANYMIKAIVLFTYHP